MHGPSRHCAASKLNSGHDLRVASPSNSLLTLVRVPEADAVPVGGSDEKGPQKTVIRSATPFLLTLPTRRFLLLYTCGSHNGLDLARGRPATCLHGSTISPDGLQFLVWPKRYSWLWVSFLSCQLRRCTLLPFCLPKKKRAQSRQTIQAYGST